MTNQELQELSKKVAIKFGIDCVVTKIVAEEWNGCCDCNGYVPITDDVWLHHDLATVMRLAIGHGVWYEFDEHNRYVLAKTHREYFVAHHTREQAVIVAVMKALLKVEV
jgi:hypothetical protein